MINEVAWAGTLANAHDEWIELHNPGANPVNLSGWILTDDGDINVALSGSISGHGFYLLERTDDMTIADIGADRIYTGALRNTGETLWLKDPTGAVVDSANKAGGSWPAGDSVSHSSMERLGGGDNPGNWRTFTGYGGIGHDAGGNPIAGTPRHPNSSFSPTPTSTLVTPTPRITPFHPLSVLINEVAWAGTHASAHDEWIELHNPGAEKIDLTDWTLTDGGDIDLNLAGSITGNGFFLLERGNDSVVSDIAADQLYNGALNNSGETLWLKDPMGIVIDSANSDGGGWPAGRSSSRASMERRGGTDIPANWGTFNGVSGLGHDAAGRPIPGTPRGINSIHFPTPVPTKVSGKVRINEVLIRPHYDWEGDGEADTGDEFIELYNHGGSPVFLRGWRLDDILDGGSRPYILPGVTLAPREYVTFFRSRTHISLNDRGDSVHLLAPNGQIIDQIRYLRVRAYNLSYGRLPDGSDELLYGLWPTPNGPNVLFIEPESEPMELSREIAYPFLCPSGGRPIPRLLRAARHPTLTAWLTNMRLFFCH